MTDDEARALRARVDAAKRDSVPKETQMAGKKTKPKPKPKYGKGKGC